jgi:hypothetical protein
MKQLTAKEILKNFDWKLEIRTAWKGEKIEKNILLPVYLQEFIESRITEYIKDGKEVSEKMYTQMGGSEVRSADALMKFINDFKKKYADKLRPHLSQYNKFPVRVYVEGEDGYISLCGKIEYTKQQLIDIAKEEFARQVNRYKDDYATMIRVQRIQEEEEGIN